jgi:hypothetical protein
MLIVNKFSEAKVHPAEEIICKIGNRPGMGHEVRGRSDQ